MFGRSERIRTSDPIVPNDVRYQAALHSDTAAYLGPAAGLIGAPAVRRKRCFARPVRIQRPPARSQELSNNKLESRGPFEGGRRSKPKALRLLFVLHRRAVPLSSSA